MKSVSLVTWVLLQVCIFIQLYFRQRYWQQAMLIGIEACNLLAFRGLCPFVHNHLHALSQLTGTAEGVTAVLLTYQLTDTLIEYEVEVHLGGGHLTSLGIASLGTIGLEGAVAQTAPPPN